MCRSKAKVTLTGCRLPLRTALFVQKNSGGEIVKNSRKTILILACLGAICLLVFGLTACNNSSPHIHNYVNLECVNCGETSTECFSFTLLRDGTYEITVKNANNLPSNIKIPAIYNKKAVTSIGSYAFSGCSSLTSIEIPNSVTLIGERAFGVCGSLTLVVIPDSVTSIGSGAFNGCSGLTSVVIGNSVTSIGSYAFFDCYKLVEVINNSPYITVAKGDLSNGFIGYYALSVSNCDVSYISKLSNDNGFIIYTDNSEKILVGYTGSETNLVLPNYITKINRYAFSACSGLTSVEIPNSITSIGDRAFYDCSSLTSVVIPNSVTLIGERAFGGCSSLTSVVIGNSVTSIGGYAFWWCVSLTSVEIGDSVTSIGESAFYGCSNLKEVNCLGTIDQWAQIEFGDYDANPLYYTKQLKINGEVVTEVNLTTATKIGSYAFYRCGGLTSVVIPNSVTTISERAFYGCSRLTSIEIPNSVTSIGEGAFANCIGLTSVVIGDSVTSIGDRAFCYCFNLTSVIVSENNQCYSSYNGDLYNKDKTTLINYAMGKSKTSPEFSIPYGVTSIGDWAFDGCSSLTSVVIPNSVTSIGNYAFNGCNGLTSVEIPNSVTSIGERAFGSCYGLTSVVIPNSATSIGNYAFYCCYSLTSVVIGDSVTSIGERAFGHCTKLKNIYYAGTQEEWDKITKNRDWDCYAVDYTITYNYKGE